MNAVEFAKYVRYKTRTNSTTFPDDELLAFMNSRLEEIAQDILKADENILLIPQTGNLVADQREYALPSDMLSRISRVEAKLDGSEWIKLEELDFSDYDESMSESEIVNNFSNNEGEAFFVILRKSIYILSGTITDVTDGLKVWAHTYPSKITDLSSTTDLSQDPSNTTLGIPRALHRIWADGVVIDYKESREKPIPLTDSELAYEIRKQRAIETLKKANMDREVFGDLPSSADRGDEGWEY
ncbi:MAG: hypothetical protein D6822_02185 [Cyanobacteria bacterium J149]|nr:MAG: hypothetical protein D6822_02185 [Cyanobacteria bacterium J149]